MFWKKSLMTIKSPQIAKGQTLKYAVWLNIYRKSFIRQSKLNPLVATKKVDPGLFSLTREADISNPSYLPVLSPKKNLPEQDLRLRIKAVRKKSSRESPRQVRKPSKL
jgi:hypothetical protein